MELLLTLNKWLDVVFIGGSNFFLIFVLVNIVDFQELSATQTHTFVH